MPSHRPPQAPGVRKAKKAAKRKQNAPAYWQQAIQLWYTQNRQSRRWLDFHMKQHTFGSIPGPITEQLMELMHAQNAAEVNQIWRRGLAPQTMELWEKLKAERDAAKAASNLFLAPDGLEAPVKI